MFGWLRRRAVERYLVADAQRTIEAVEQLTAADRNEVANELLREIAFAKISLSRIAAGIAPLVQTAFAMIVQRGRNLRHAALEAGATSWEDKRWAAAALYESWTMAVCGQFGKSRAKALVSSIDQFIERELSSVEIERIHQIARAGGARALGLRELKSD